MGIQAGRNLRRVFSWVGRRGGWWRCRFPSLTLSRVPVFALQGPATSAGPSTARAAARRLPCWCAPGSPASRARSRSNTPTEPAPGTGPARLARLCWTTTTDKEFSSAFSQERDGGRPQGGREVKGGAKPAGRAGQGQALSPEPAQGLLHTNVSKENSALANGEILHAAITGWAGEGWGQCPCAGVAPGSPSVRRSRKHTRTHRC